MASQQPTSTIAGGTVIQRKTVVEMIQEVQKRIQSFGPGPYYNQEQAKELEKLKMIYAKLTNQDPTQATRRVMISTAPNLTTSQVQIGMAAPPVTKILTGPSAQQTIAAMQRIAPAATTMGGVPQTTVIPASTAVTLLAQSTAIPGQVHTAPASVVTSPAQIHQIRVQGQAATTTGAVPVQVTATQPTVVTRGVVPQVAIQGQVKVTVPTSTVVQTLVQGQRTLVGSPAPTVQVATGGQPTVASLKHVPGGLPAGVKITTHQPGVVQSVQMQRQLAPSKISAVPGGTSTIIPNIAPAPSSSSVPKSLVSHGGLTSHVEPASSQPGQVLTKRRLQELLHEIDPREQMDDEVEDILLQVADDFIENVVNASAQIAKHRKSNTLEVKDVQLHLERNWNMWIPGFGSDELRPYKKAATTEAHKQRLALIRKSLKK